MIPTIRLDDPDCHQVVRCLRQACVEHGFFYLEGHGIDPAFLEKVMQQSKLLFDLPLDQKMEIKDPVLNRGYTEFEEETLDPSKQTKGDTKEGFYIGKHTPENSPDYNPAHLKGPQPWPTCENDLDCTLFKTTMQDYFEKASQVAFRLVQLLALAIGLEDEHYFDDSFQNPMALLRLLHYSKEPSFPQHGVYACGAHSDYGMITLLLTDENPGLQIFTKQQEWIHVPPKPHAFVVNLGDMLERWTNGLFRSTLHRVLTCAQKERYSIPFFYEPDFDTRVECLEICCSNDNPPKWKPTTSGQHLLDKYKETHTDFFSE
jgi:isopenicillin N synthase-like dioxygenase